MKRLIHVVIGVFIAIPIITVAGLYLSLKIPPPKLVQNKNLSVFGNEEFVGHLNEIYANRTENELISDLKKQRFKVHEGRAEFNRGIFPCVEKWYISWESVDNELKFTSAGHSMVCL